MISLLLYTCKNTKSDPVPSASGDSSRYIYHIQGCIDQTPAFGGCFESLQLKHDTAFVNWGDMIEIMEYALSGDTILVKDFFSNNVRYTFLHSHPDTLVFIEQNEKWVRGRN